MKVIELVKACYWKKDVRKFQMNRVKVDNEIYRVNYKRCGRRRVRRKGHHQTTYRLTLFTERQRDTVSSIAQGKSSLLIMVPESGHYLGKKLSLPRCNDNLFKGVDEMCS